METSRKTLQINSVCWLILATRIALGQAPPMGSVAEPDWETAAGGKMEFSVASVRQSQPGTPYSSNVRLDGLDGPPVGNLFAANAPLHAYLLFAYKISDSNQALGIYDKLPSWGKPPQFFNIQARAEALPTRDQLRLMVQALLVDRFKLSIHREIRMRNEYLIVLDKPDKLGPQLRPHPTNKPCVIAPNAVTMIDAPAEGTEVPRYCGMVRWSIDGQQHLRMIDVTPAQIVNLLSGTGAAIAGGTMTPRSGVDGTGLSGRFDLDLQFMPEDNVWGSIPNASGPTFTKALENQLGLKLTERRGPVEMLFIDHIEKPSEN